MTSLLKPEQMELPELERRLNEAASGTANYNIRLLPNGHTQVRSLKRPS